MKRLDPSRKLPRALQWVDQAGKLRDTVGDDMALFGSAFCLPVKGKRLYVPEDLIRPCDKKFVPINELIKRRRKMNGKNRRKIEAEEKELRIQAFIANGMGENADNNDWKNKTGYQYPHGETNVNLRGLAKMTDRYGQVFTEN